MEIVDYLLARKKAGGGSDVTIEQLSVTENGTYSEQGIAYSPVVVNVPAPENSYQLTDAPAGAVSTIEDGTDLPMSSLKVGIEPVQDLHGYDHPWAGGAGKNLLPYPSLDNGWVNGYLYGSDGTIAPASSENKEMTSDYIPIKAETSYMFSYALSDSKELWIGSLFFDSTKTAIGDRIIIWSSTKLRVTAPAEAMYVRISFRTYGIVSWAQLEEGSTATSYEPYSNICPISGWTAANVMRSGKNLTDGATVGHYIQTDGTFGDADSYRSTDYINVDGITTLKATVSTTYPNFWVWRIASYDTNKNFIELSLNRIISNGNFNEEVTLPSNAKYIRACAIVVSTNWTIYDKSIYNIYTIQFTDGDNPLTVYGGTLDVTTGELVVDRASVTLNGSENWLLYQDLPSSINQLYINIANIKPSYDTIMTMCDRYKSIFIVNRNGNYNSCYSGRDGICFNIENTTVNEWKASLQANNVQVVYKLETPTTYHLTPTQIRTLVGNNNIWADTGDVLSGKYFKEL